MPQPSEPAPIAGAAPDDDLLAAHLRRIYAVPLPAPDFASVLAQHASRQPVQLRRRLLPGRRTLTALSVAAVLAVAVVAILFLAGRGSPPVSAQDILDRAQSAATNSAARVSTYHLVSASRGGKN